MVVVLGLLGLLGLLLYSSNTVFTIINPMQTHHEESLRIAWETAWTICS